mmetsp:Transcript_95974/g.205913  ORF Transcript_95974/g.205913 Transcript_95974/m.205913 type:complete len:393 (-) Transcript_95974:9-1187(-)
MRCGTSSVQRQRLKETQAQIAERKRDLDSKDQQIQQHTDRLVRTVGLRSERESLRRELEASCALHEMELEREERRLQAEHEGALRRRLLQKEEDAERALTVHTQSVAGGAGTDGAAMPGTEAEADAAQVEMAARFAEEVTLAEAVHRERIRLEALRVERSREELVAARAEHRRLAQERNSEAEAASVTREALFAERRTAQRHGEVLTAEARLRASETEALRDAQNDLEGQARSLQRELGKVSYTVGQRDHELQVKDSELQEVHQSIASIQEEMDEVNRQLEGQCSRVRQVEGSLRLSRDLGEKVRAMREMLKESDGALSELCALLERERAQREQCAHGLKQQGMRTELLLQLLHHFKNRTHDLGPQALLAGPYGSGCGACGAELAGGGAGLQ